ncbi:MAG: hypothetical protein AAFY65_01345 [Pseudomonadota bacterium]
MPRRDTKSTLYSDHSPDASMADPQDLLGIPYVTTGMVTNEADDSFGSTFLLCELPSTCYLDPATFFTVGAWGFDLIRIGTADEISALVGQAKSVGSLIQPVAAGDADYDRPLWQVLDLTEDPGGNIAIYAHAAGAATAAGQMRFRFVTIRNN